MKQLLQNRYQVTLDREPETLASALQMRAVHFGAGDGDEFDAICTHVLILDTQTGELVCTFRFLHMESGVEIARTYAAQHYDLANLADFEQPIMEIGRFCVNAETTDPNVLRIAWAAITRYVDENDIGFLCGCSSFSGNDWTPYEHAFALLKHRHLAPQQWRPMAKSNDVIAFGRDDNMPKPDIRLANQQLPSLLRTYLTMGGWVSDHAVIDPSLNTIHVFTGVEINEIPAARKRLLRANVA
jgi:putative hemolysin